MKQMFMRVFPGKRLRLDELDTCVKLNPCRMDRATVLDHSSFIGLHYGQLSIYYMSSRRSSYGFSSFLKKE
jgi:hypothetical protein